MKKDYNQGGKMAVDYLNEKDKIIKRIEEIADKISESKNLSKIKLSEAPKDVQEFVDKIADFIEKERKRVVEKVNIAYHAIRSHRSYGRNDSPHLERAEKALYEVMKLSRLGD